MALEKYISQLLHEYEFVVLPGWGAFVCDYEPAKIDTNKNILPPRKKINFNPKIQLNDGLVIEKIMFEEQLSFDEAFKVLIDKIDNWKVILNFAHELKMGDVGMFKKSSNGIISFHQNQNINFLADVYGFQELNFPEIIRENKTKKVEKKLVESIEKGKVIALNPRKNWLKYAAAAVFIPFAGAIAWLSLVADPVNNNQILSAILSPFNNTIERLYKPLESHNFLLEDYSEVSDTTYLWIKSYIKAERDSTYVKNNTKQFEVKAISTISKYHIIGGCFSEKANAEKMCLYLVNLGFKAQIILYEKGLYAVSYHGFDDYFSAREALKEIQASYNSQAWLKTF